MDQKPGACFCASRLRENFSNCLNELTQIVYPFAKTPLLFFAAVGVNSVQPQSR